MSENEQKLENILRNSPAIWEILEKASSLGLSNWYLSAGCIAQTVWNDKQGHEPHYGIRDYDLVYYDASDTSYEGEDVYIQMGAKLFAHLPAPVEIRNQARVHLWFEKRFGKKIAPYTSSEEAIGSWATTVTSVGVRREKGETKIFAPNGLGDLLNMTVRPNKKIVTKDSRDVYLGSVKRWRGLWPNVNILPWK